MTTNAEVTQTDHAGPPPIPRADEYRAKAALSAGYAHRYLNRGEYEEAAAWCDMARTELAVSEAYRRHGEEAT